MPTAVFQLNSCGFIRCGCHSKMLEAVAVNSKATSIISDWLYSVEVDVSSMPFCLLFVAGDYFPKD